MNSRHTIKGTTTAYVVSGALAALLLTVGGCWAAPQYRVYNQNMSGQANLTQQTWEKKIRIEEARAAKESAVLMAEAEVARAKGVKEANEIIQQSLGGPEGYLRYLYIQTLKDIDANGGQIIYVPTEAGLPILEAGKR